MSEAEDKNIEDSILEADEKPNLRQLVRTWAEALVKCSIVNDSDAVRTYYKDALNVLDKVGFKHVQAELKETMPTKKNSIAQVLKAGVAMMAAFEDPAHKKEFKAAQVALRKSNNAPEGEK